MESKRGNHLLDKHRVRRVCLMVLVAVLLLPGGGEGPFSTDARAEGKDLYQVDLEPRQLNKTTDIDDLTIIVPDEDEGDWKSIGEAIANTFKDRWGIETSVVVSRPEDIANGWEDSALIIGNLGNNDHMARLYGLRLAYSDAIHPGKGGYQLQTIVDPFGLDGNTIILGASDVPGAERGKDRLLDILETVDEPFLPWLAEASVSEQVSEALPYGSAPTDDDLEKGLANAEALLANLDPDPSGARAMQTLQLELIKHGEYYQLTNHPHYGEIYRHLLLGYSAYLNQYPDEGKDQLNERANMWKTGSSLIAAWTVLEASPIFTEEDREQILSALYLTYEANYHDSYLVNAPDVGARYNHDVFPALSLYFGASYFIKYYGLPESEEWLARGRQIFVGNTSNINLDEGSDYLMHVPSVTLDYAMATGDDRFLSKGLRPSADLNALMIDNLGTMSGGGDVYPFGFSSAYKWDHSNVMNAASWFFDEPIYQFLLERTRTGPFDGQNMDDLKYPFHRYLTDKVNTDEIPEGSYPLVKSYPVEQGVYDELLKERPEGLDVPQSETFHKLAFREGLELEDSYLMLDGFSAGRHGHHDGNTIIKYSSEGRIFIGDRDYIERGPKYHTGVMVIKDGIQEEKPPLASLKWAADANGIGISRSVVPNYNGADWDRAIVSPGGRFFIIYDQMTFNEDGDYILENTWQTLGEPNIKRDRFEVEQQGAKMVIQSLDNSDLRMYNRYGHFIKYWKDYYPYPYADEENVLREVKEETAYQAGDTDQFINVLSSGTAGKGTVKTKRLNETTLSIQEDRTDWLAQWGDLETTPLTSDGAFHLVSEDEMLLAEVEQLRLGEQQLSFAQPVMVKLDRETQTWQAHTLKGGLTQYDEDGNPIDDGLVESGHFSFSKKDFKQIMREMTPPEEADKLEKPQHPQPTGANNWKKAYDFQRNVTSSAYGDLNGDGQDEIILGGDDGQVDVIDPEGRVTWSFRAQGRVNEVSVQEIDDVPLVFVATEEWMLHVLNADGEEMWQHEFPHGTYQTSEVKGNLLGLTNVRVAYPNGRDEDPWIMVGTQFRHIYGLTVEGEVIYNDLAYYYGIEDMEFADVDGDGKDEGFIGTEYYYYHVWDNKSLADRYGFSDGPGWKVVDVVENWHGGDLPVAALGTKEHRLHVVQYKDGDVEELWRKNVGGEVNDITHGDFNGNGETELLVGSDGFQFYVFDPDGTERVRTSLEDRVLSVNGLHHEADPYLVSADNGRLYQLSDTGEVTQKAVFKDRIADVQVTDGGRQAWVILENGHVYKRTIDAEGMKALVERLTEEEEIKREEAAHALHVHLTAVGRFEAREAGEKVIKHMEGFKQLLAHQREKEWISEKAHTILLANAASMMKKWH